ncbi:MAG: MGMT family protein [Candidatus Acidifodinimicrobium sp.]
MNNDTRIRILKALRKIPRGKVTTYKALAKRFNVTPREVGRVLSTNDRPEYYPCYKVVKSNREIGGYTIGNKNNEKTKSEKIKRLKADGVEVRDGRVHESAVLKT